jgi:predicted 3-demethylubiquinone-9 3-methyltransferase (glyoxalase superfamily)
MMAKIAPFLWFNDQAEEAMHYYCSIFKNSEVLSTMPGPGGKAMGATFRLEDQEIMALNGGPQFQLNEAFSFFVNCDDQAEVDYYWDRLTADGGEESRCGWLKDKYGLSWQIVPKQMMELFGDSDREKAGRAVQAMLTMNKLDVAELQRAFDGA